MKPATIALGAALALVACGGSDEYVPVDAPVSIDAVPLIDAPTLDAPADAEPVDAPPAGVSCLASVSALTITEGASATVAVTLSAQPQGAKVCTVAVGDATAIAATPVSLAFTPANFQTPQLVAVTALQDANNVAEQTTVTLSTAGGTDAVVAVSTVDDD